MPFAETPAAAPFERAPPAEADAQFMLQQNHPAAWAWALACCGRNREAAHDVLHDVYVKILAGRARFDRLSSFKTWLFGVIRLTARNAQRKAAFVNLFFE